jgi:hypothetical protein
VICSPSRTTGRASRVGHGGQPPSILLEEIGLEEIGLEAFALGRRELRAAGGTTGKRAVTTTAELTPQEAQVSRAGEDLKPLPVQRGAFKAIARSTGYGVG